MPLLANPGSSGIRSTREENEAFSEIVGLIAASRERALQAVNTALIELYWKIGETISLKIEAAEWGDAVVDRLAQFIATTEPGMRGFTRRNLFRMKRFYETYRENAIVTPLVSQLPWSHHLVILEQSKRPEEREFYLRVAIRERWSKRELETPVQGCPVRAGCPQSTKSDAGGGTNVSGSTESFSGRLHRGIPRPA
jgi:predicted nuclease of restriction endonuclease-like (RecB) superfamily